MPLGPIRKGAGQRRHPVQIQKATRIEDALGGQEEERWDVHVTVHGAVDPLQVVAGTDKPELLFQIAVPYRAAVLAEQRVGAQRAVATGRTFSVLAVTEPESKRRDLILHCVEIDVA